MRPSSIAIIGTTTWGTTLGILLGRQGLQVKLWARSAEESRLLNERRENPSRLPGYRFPPSLSVFESPEEALDGADMVILAVPAQRLRENLRRFRKFLDNTGLILNVAKGLEAETGKLPSQVIAEELPQSHPGSVCTLSGPNLAREIIRGLPAATVAAGERAEDVRDILEGSNLRVEVTRDVVGVELGGAFKNVIALGAGMVEGLGYGDNAKAAFISMGLREMVSLGRAAGAQEATFFGLAGLGDIIVTCFSPLSRNHYVGVELGKGRSLQEVLDSMIGVAEGVSTTEAALKLGKSLSVSLPITESLYRVLFEGFPAHKAIAEILGTGNSLP